MHEQHIQQAINEQKPMQGMKVMSLLMLIPLFNIIKCFPPEYMNSVLLGITKLFFFS